MYRTFSLIKALHSQQCAICNTHIFYNRNYYARELPIIMRVKGGIMQQATRPLLTHPVGNVTNMCFAMTLIAHTHSACFNYGESDILFVKVSARVECCSVSVGGRDCYFAKGFWGVKMCEEGDKGTVTASAEIKCALAGPVRVKW